MLPKPWYRPPCEGGRSSGRVAFASPSVEKKASLAAFWSGNDVADGLGVPVGVDEKEAGEPERAVLDRAEALDLRRPWADEGRPGAPRELGADSLSAEGGDGDHDLPASSASSYVKRALCGGWGRGIISSYLLTILGSSPRVVRVIRTHTLGITTLIGGVGLHELFEWFVPSKL